MRRLTLLLLLAFSSAAQAVDFTPIGGGFSSSQIDTSAELAAIVTDETGSGALVFGTAPTFSGNVTAGRLLVSEAYVYGQPQIYHSSIGNAAGIQIVTNAEVAIYGSGQPLLATNTTTGVRINGACTFGWTSGHALGTPDVTLYRDAADILALRHGTNAQNYRVYNTDNGANDEYLQIGFTSSVAKIDTVQTGTGTQRNLTLTAPTITLSGKLSHGAAGALTIATGTITVTKGYHTIDTEAAAATDDLDTINGGAEGDRLVVRAANAARTVVVKDGTGNLKLAGDCSLDNSEDTIELIHDGTNWLEVCRSNNGA